MTHTLKECLLLRTKNDTFIVEKRIYDKYQFLHSQFGKKNEHVLDQVSEETLKRLESTDEIKSYYDMNKNKLDKMKTLKDYWEAILYYLYLNTLIISLKYEEYRLNVTLVGYVDHSFVVD